MTLQVSMWWRCLRGAATWSSNKLFSFKSNSCDPWFMKATGDELGSPSTPEECQETKSWYKRNKDYKRKKKKNDRWNFFLLPSYQDIWHQVDGSGHELGLSGGGIRITFTRNDLDSLDWPHWVSSFQFKDWIMQQKCPYLIAQPIRRQMSFNCTFRTQVIRKNFGGRLIELLEDSQS